MKKREFYEQEKIKKYISIFSITLIVSFVLFLTVFVMYSKKLEEDANESLNNLGMMEGLVSNEEIEETSFSSDLSVSAINSNSVKNTIIKEKNANKKTINKIPVESVVTNTLNENKITNKATNTISENIVTNNVGENIVEEKELKFSPPVEGEIIKDFALESLIFSETLEEWTTHPGIDIKAEKMSIVTAAENGTIESIKNDPRYGLTITISHKDGFKTVYSNLLTTEFVKENDNVEKGQTIATVGESASFEVADESHVHFEMYKDGNLVNPTIYLK